MSVSEEERQSIFEEFWQIGGPALYASFNDINRNPDNNQAVADFVRAKIRKIVKDPKVAEMLCPTHTFGCKRGVIDNGFFETFNRSNLLLVDVSAVPIETITPRVIRTTEADYDLDIIIFATGFDAMTGTLLKIDIQGRKGMTLREKWAAGPLNYLVLNVSGIPNLFTITGPGSPSVTANMMVDIKQHVEWITDCIH